MNLSELPQQYFAAKAAKNAKKNRASVHRGEINGAVSRSINPKYTK